MPSLSFIIKCEKNTDYVLSPEELFSVYFYGITIEDNDCTKFPNEVVKHYIKSAQGEIENTLDLKFLHDLIDEQLDYYRDDYENNFPFVPTALPVNKARTMIGRLNGVEQIVYPEAWLANRFYRTGVAWRHLGIVPNGSVVNADSDVILTGISSYYGLRSYPQVPKYWFIQYETGWLPNQIPQELMNLVGLWASIPILAIAGDLILGAGIASQSLSIDGLSQSISSTSSATNAGYGARIVEYRKTVTEAMKNWKRVYKGIRFTSL